MASVLKAQKVNASAKAKGKRKAGDMNVDAIQDDNDAQPKKKKNKQRVLLLSSRGITHRMRHLMNDLETLLPHVKKGKNMPVLEIGHKLTGGADAKLDSKNHLNLLPELADLHNCNNTLYFEARRHEDLYMWAAKTPNGPSIKMHVQNVHTMDELKMTGNCLKGSRGLLSFDASFEETEWGRLTKEVFTHVRTDPLFVCAVTRLILRFGRYSVYHLKHDEQSHSSTTSLHSLFWTARFGSAIFRYLRSPLCHMYPLDHGSVAQILEKDPSQPSGPPKTSLVEIGPRFVLTPIRIFEGAFGGATVFSNPGTFPWPSCRRGSFYSHHESAEFISPASVRSAIRREQGDKYRVRKDAELERAGRKEGMRREEDELAVAKVFA